MASVAMVRGSLGGVYLLHLVWCEVEAQFHAVGATTADNGTCRRAHVYISTCTSDRVNSHKNCLSERAPQEEQNSANISFVALSSEELWGRKELRKHLTIVHGPWFSARI